MKVGFIGLGNVGAKLSGSLLRNGVDLVVHDLSSDLVSDFVAKGAQAADSLSRARCRGTENRVRHMRAPGQPVRDYRGRCATTLVQRTVMVIDRQVIPTRLGVAEENHLFHGWNYHPALHRFVNFGFRRRQGSGVRTTEGCHVEPALIDRQVNPFAGRAGPAHQTAGQATGALLRRDVGDAFRDVIAATCKGRHRTGRLAGRGASGAGVQVLDPRQIEPLCKGQRAAIRGP